MLSNFLDWVSSLVGNGGGGNAVADTVGGALSALVSDVGGMVETCLPFGIAIMGICAAPRLIKRVVHSFM